MSNLVFISMAYSLGLLQLLRDLLQSSAVPLSHLLDLWLVVFHLIIDGFLQLCHLLLSFGPLRGKDTLLGETHLGSRVQRKQKRSDTNELNLAYMTLHLHYQKANFEGSILGTHGGAIIVLFSYDMNGKSKKKFRTNHLHNKYAICLQHAC